MAKDKSKSTEKGKASKAETKKGGASKKGGGDDFGKPSEAPAGEGWNLTEEAEGELLLVTPLREDEVNTSWGDKKIIVAEVVVLNEKKPEKSELHEDVYVFGGYLRGALRGFIGEKRVVGRLVKGEPKKKGENAPWLLEDATEAELDVARAYLASIDPLSSGKKSKK